MTTKAGYYMWQIVFKVGLLQNLNYFYVRKLTTVCLLSNLRMIAGKQTLFLKKFETKYLIYVLNLLDKNVQINMTFQ